jgi:hypothetical protein
LIEDLGVMVVVGVQVFVRKLWSSEATRK